MDVLLTTSYQASQKWHPLSHYLGDVIYEEPLNSESFEVFEDLYVCDNWKFYSVNQLFRFVTMPKKLLFTKSWQLSEQSVVSLGE